MHNVSTVILLVVLILALVLYVLGRRNKPATAHKTKSDKLAQAVGYVVLVVIIFGFLRAINTEPSIPLFALGLVRLLPIAVLVAVVFMLVYVLVLGTVKTENGERRLYKEAPSIISGLLFAVRIHRLEKSKSKGNYAHGISKYEQIITRLKNNNAPPDRITACMNNLAHWHIEAGDITTAIEILHEARLSYADALREHYQISVYYSLAYAYLKNNNKDDYLRYRQMLEVLIEEHAVNHPNHSNYHLLGYLNEKVELQEEHSIDRFY